MGVDVVTAVHAAYAKFLPDAWRSLLEQTRQDWTWLLQVDGAPAGEVMAALGLCGALDDARVRLSVNGTREGAAITRNVALGRSTAALVQTLDADDMLEADAIESLADALVASPDAGFAVGHARDLMPYGALLDHPLPIGDGRLPRGSLAHAWVTDPGKYRLPVHPAGVLWRRDLLLAVGGWSALKGMEDTGLLMAASAVAEGVLINKSTLRYRKHRAQQSAQTTNFSGGGRRLRSFAHGSLCCLPVRPGGRVRPGRIRLDTAGFPRA
jgi:glycosyltransferase involved in cell wall biosynthesis